MIEDTYLCLNCKELFNESERIKDFSIDEKGRQYYPPWSYYCPYCRSKDLEHFRSLDKKIKSDKELEDLWKRDRRRKILKPILYQVEFCITVLVFSISFVFTKNLVLAIMNTLLCFMFFRMFRGYRGLKWT